MTEGQDEQRKRQRFSKIRGYDGASASRISGPSSYGRLGTGGQFAPFAALTGYGDAVKERARLTKARPQLDEEEMEQINRKLLWLRGHLDQQPEIAVTYFLPDQRKEGGAWAEVYGKLKKIREGEGRLVMEDGRVIPIQDLIEIKM